MSLRSVGPLLLAAAALAIVPAAPASAQLEISGQVDLTAREGADERGLNRNFRGDSPFNDVRMRLFARHWLTDRIGIFTEVLFDRGSGPRLNGAYLVVNELAGRDWLDLRAGLAPSLIGTFGLRSTYFNSNPLIGVPLVWQHRTTLDGSGLATAADLLRRRDENDIFLPMLYDACWNLQWEFLGEFGRFEYSVGVTPGSMSNPLPTPDRDGLQLLARLGVEPVMGVRLGVSGGVGPYIGGPNRDPAVNRRSFPGRPRDFDQRLLGVDLEVARGKLRLVSEGYISSWEAPLVSEDLTAVGGYAEARYDFLPRWIGAVRLGTLGFSEIPVTAVDGTGGRGWDDDVLRLESALTYRWARELHARLGWQHTTFLTGPEESVDLLALQLRAVF